MLAEHSSQDLYHITNFIGNLQGNVSLALGCSQSQLWLQSVAAAIIREGETGLFPQEVGAIIARNHTTTDFEKTYQAWWKLVNFTYNPFQREITAFVLATEHAKVLDTFPVLSLGTIHQGVVVRLMGHNVWAKSNPKTQSCQTISIEASSPREQLGFICENAITGNEDLCLDTEDSTCIIEMISVTHAGSQVYYIEKGCACLRTVCENVTITVLKKQMLPTFVCVISPKSLDVILIIPSL